MIWRIGRSLFSFSQTRSASIECPSVFINHLDSDFAVSHLPDGFAKRLHAGGVHGGIGTRGAQ